MLFERDDPYRDVPKVYPGKGWRERPEPGLREAFG
jgi:hypothetical protein